MQILIAESNERLRSILCDMLARRYYLIEETDNGQDAFDLGISAQFDAIILDADLPRLDGVTILRKWRDQDVTVPVLLIRTLDTRRDRVDALRAGADDCLSKPFATEELIARLETIIRRAHGKAASRLKVDALEIDPGACSVHYFGNEVRLTALEFRTLYYLGLNTGRVVSQSELIEHIYNQELDLGSNVIEVVVSRIRRKLDPGIIRTRRGHGYLVSPSESVGA